MASLPINTNDLGNEIKQLIAEKSLDVITSKMIRKHLEAKFNCPLEAFKAEIDEQIEHCIGEMELAKTDKQKQTPDNVAENNSNSSPEAETSESDFDQPSISASISTNNRKRKSMAIDNSSETDQVEDMASAVKRRRSAAKPAPKRREQKAKNKKEKGGRKRNSVFSKICVLSPELASLMGKYYMRRADVVKTMWAYFRSNNLMDPKNKQFVLLDDALKRIFGKKTKIKAFGMMGELTKHIKDVSHLDGESRAQAEADIAEILAQEEANENGTEEVPSKGTTPNSATNNAVENENSATSNSSYSNEGTTKSGDPSASESQQPGTRADQQNELKESSDESDSNESESSDSNDA